MSCAVKERYLWGCAAFYYSSFRVRECTQGLFVTKGFSNFVTQPIVENRVVTRALIGGVYIHIFRSFFSVSFEIKLISKEVSRAEPEYMNIHPPPN